MKEPTMYKKIVVAYDDSDAGRDALSLADTLRAPDAVVLAATEVTPTALPDWVQARPLTGDATAAALHGLAQENDADLLVVPSHKGGGPDRDSCAAELFVDHAPCSVAVAPPGYRSHDRPLQLIGIALDSSADAAVAVREGSALAHSLGASVRLLSVKAPLPHWAEEAALDVGYHLPQVDRFRRDRRRTLLDRTAQALAKDVTCETNLLQGNPVHALLEEAEQGTDLLVLGSRSRGAARRVALGDTTAGVIRAAACPVLIIPRGSGNPDDPERQDDPSEEAAMPDASQPHMSSGGVR